MLTYNPKHISLVALLGALLSVVLFSIPARADILSPTQKQGVWDLLSSMECEQDHFGFDDVDFSDTCIAGPFAIYQYTNDGLTHGCEAYFLIEDGQIVSLLREGLGNQFFSFASEGQAIARTVEQYSLADFALIQAANGVYLTDGSSLFYSYRPTIRTEEGLLSLASAPLPPDNLNTVKLNSVATAESLAYRPTIPQRSFGYLNGYKYCEVNHVVQTMEYTCWAASCAMIINYHRGSSYSDYDVAYVYSMLDGHPINEPRELSDVQCILNREFGTDTYSIYNACPSYNAVQTVIDADHPFVAYVTRYYGPDNPYFGIGHYVVVDGYNPTNQRICLWDPDYAQNDYESAALYNGYYYYIPHATAPFYAYINATVYR